MNPGLRRGFVAEPGQKDESWGGVFGVTSKIYTASPCCAVTIPVKNAVLKDGDKLEDRRVTAEVAMDVLYPAPSGAATYKEVSQTLTAQFRLFLLSPAEGAEYRELKRHFVRLRAVRILLFWAAVLAGEVLLAWLTSRLCRVITKWSVWSFTP